MHFSFLRKIEIKYGFESLKKMNNVLHRNFTGFEMDFEVKIWEAKVYF
jgi:hypothetical protein